MPLADMTALLRGALEGGYGLGYFEAWDEYSIDAVLDAAHAERSPVIIGFGGVMADQAWLECGAIQVLAGIGRVRAEQARVPVSLIFNEAQSYEQAVRCIDSGFNAVMLDTGRWSGDLATENVRRLAAYGHERNVCVEGELGCLPDATPGGIEDSDAYLTDPDAAARFVEATHIDCLAVSIGNVHLLADATASVDLERLSQIRQRVDVPLVIHGGTGFPASCVAGAISCGVAKFNVGTVLKKEFLAGVREHLFAATTQDVHRLVGSRKADDLLLAGAYRMTEKVRELMRLYGSSGRASTWEKTA